MPDTNSLVPRPAIDVCGFSANRHRTKGVVKMEQEKAQAKGAKQCAGAAQIGKMQTFSWDDR